MYQATQVKEVMGGNPQAVTHTGTLTVRFDTLGADFATVRVPITLSNTVTIASADGLTITLKESDDTNSSNYATFTSGGITAGAVMSKVKVAAGTAQAVAFVDLRARKRYLICLVIPGTSGVTNEDATVAVGCTLSRLEQSPHSTTMTDVIPIGGSTNDVAVVG